MRTRWAYLSAAHLAHTLSGSVRTRTSCRFWTDSQFYTRFGPGESRQNLLTSEPGSGSASREERLQNQNRSTRR